MSNYKIRVNSEAGSKEAQELFFELGYEKGVCSTGGYPALIIATPESRFQKTPYSSRATSLNHEAHSQYKEITLPELRDLVVLKRNDVGDATHESPCGELKFILLGDWWNLFTGGKWQQFSHKQSPRCNKLKPIEKPMKEYLRKNSNGTYSYIGMVRPEHVSDFMIEIPEGAIKAYLNNSKTINFINADDDYMNSATNGEWINTHRGKHEACGHELIWQRHTHPEELPFIDDEPSLNDQYAEIETVRKKTRENNHYFIDVSDVDEVDFYEIAKRYNVTDPAIQHILKKCLAIGNRGHKDLETDLMDILKTAKRALRINGFGEPK